MSKKGLVKRIEDAAAEVAEDVAECWTEANMGTEASHSEVERYTEMTVKNQRGFEAFFDAFLKGDVDAVMDAMSDDPVFDSPFPQPDGLIVRGRAAVRLVWEATFALKPSFEVEESFVTGDRGVARWKVTVPHDGNEVSLRGADIFQMKDGKVAVKMTYTKADSVHGLFALPDS